MHALIGASVVQVMGCRRFAVTTVTVVIASSLRHPTNSYWYGPANIKETY
jgi:hypothetical protein